ncbi:UDP-glycosyltransferase 90A1-like [Forsythia ovata]|uniref:UDP-glycosyltransferase 90A1-like n=1 Tax=Forsythia ovata TaxID=205694 RepID=A0ABD1WW58_9LAMI
MAWPMMAEQPLNAKMIVEEIGIGLRIETSDGSMNGFVKWKKLKKLVKELIEGEMGKELGRRILYSSMFSFKALKTANKLSMNYLWKWVESLSGAIDEGFIFFRKASFEAVVPQSAE